MELISTIYKFLAAHQQFTLNLLRQCLLLIKCFVTNPRGQLYHGRLRLTLEEFLVAGGESVVEELGFGEDRSLLCVIKLVHLKVLFSVEHSSLLLLVRLLLRKGQTTIVRVILQLYCNDGVVLKVWHPVPSFQSTTLRVTFVKRG